MLISYAKPISKTFNFKNTRSLTIWTKEKALRVIRRFLLEELSYDEVDDALDFLEEEYPICRQVIRRLRCCILFDEFFEYEQQSAVYATRFLQLKRSLQ